MTPRKRANNGIVPTDVRSPLTPAPPRSSARAAAVNLQQSSMSRPDSMRGSPGWHSSSRHVQHALQRYQRCTAQSLVDFDAGRAVYHRQIQLLQRVERHERASGTTAATVGAGGRDESLISGMLAHLVNDVAFCCDNEFTRRRLDHVVRQATGRTDMVGLPQHRFRAFRMGNHDCLGMPDLQLDKFSLRELFMDDAASWPQGHFSPRLALQIGSKVTIRREEDRAVRRQL